MCGIFGCVEEMDLDKAYECIRKLRHRGPDAIGVKKLQGVTLAQARLSILDVSDIANQPFVDITGRYWIVYNGEIYNFLELKKELEGKGHKFITQSDTEVLLYSYIEWGEEFQYKCNGMWAIAIWDDLEKKLFLSRDRFGIKPLYIYINHGFFYFASEMKAFFPIMERILPDIELLRKGNYLSFESSERCVIKDIVKFPAGHCAVYSQKEYKVRRWWNTLDHLMEVPSDYNEQVECLRELFLDACRIRMRSDVPIGTALSGGIDSSAVIGGMNYVSGKKAERMSEDWQHAFVASLPGTVIDETRYARVAAKHVGIEAIPVEINSKVNISELLQDLYLCEVPYLTVPIPFIQTYKRIRDNGIKVTLDGHGSDELFGGYNTGILAACYDVKFDETELDGLNKIYDEMSYVESGRHLGKYDMVLGAIHRYHQITEMEGNGLLDTVNRVLYNEVSATTLPTLLRCYDRYSMANGLEIRMPFMDYRIVAFAFSIPWTSKFNGGYTKAIVRDMAKPFMTSEILERKDKIGFAAPLADWLKGDWKEFILDTISSRDFCDSELVNAMDVCIDYHEFLKKDACLYDGERIWQKIAPYLWFQAIKANM